MPEDLSETNSPIHTSPKRTPEKTSEKTSEKTPEKTPDLNTPKLTDEEKESDNEEQNLSPKVMVRAGKKDKVYTNPLTKEEWTAARRRDVTDLIQENGGKWPVKTPDPKIDLSEYLAGAVFAWEGTKQIKILVKLRVRRELDVRNGRTIALHRQQNVEAAVAFLVGKKHTKGCGHCQKGNGPFTGCITVENGLRGACANCHYGGEGNRCEYHENSK